MPAFFLLPSSLVPALAAKLILTASEVNRANSPRVATRWTKYRLIRNFLIPLTLHQKADTINQSRVAWSQLWDG